eukprot:491930_1
MKTVIFYHAKDIIHVRVRLAKKVTLDAAKVKILEKIQKTLTPPEPNIFDPNNEANTEEHEDDELSNNDQEETVDVTEDEKDEQQMKDEQRIFAAREFARKEPLQMASILDVSYAVGPHFFRIYDEEDWCDMLFEKPVIEIIYINHFKHIHDLQRKESVRDDTSAHNDLPQEDALHKEEDASHKDRRALEVKDTINLQDNEDAKNDLDDDDNSILGVFGGTDGLSGSAPPPASAGGFTLSPNAPVPDYIQAQQTHTYPVSEPDTNRRNDYQQILQQAMDTTMQAQALLQQSNQSRMNQSRYRDSFSSSRSSFGDRRDAMYKKAIANPPCVFKGIANDYAEFKRKIKYYFNVYKVWPSDQYKMMMGDVILKGPTFNMVKLHLDEINPRHEQDESNEWLAECVKRIWALLNDHYPYDNVAKYRTVIKGLKQNEDVAPFLIKFKTAKQQLDREIDLENREGGSIKIYTQFSEYEYGAMLFKSLKSAVRSYIAQTMIQRTGHKRVRMTYDLVLKLSREYIEIEKIKNISSKAQRIDDAEKKGLFVLDDAKSTETRGHSDTQMCYNGRASDCERRSRSRKRPCNLKHFPDNTPYDQIDKFFERYYDKKCRNVAHCIHINRALTVNESF